VKKNLLCGLLIVVLAVSTLNFAGVQLFIGEVTAIENVPAIQLEKSVNATTIHSGDGLQYTFNVTNTGDAILYNVTVVDDTFDFIANPVIGPTTLAPGESNVALLNVTIGGQGTLTNIANATGTTQNGITVIGVDAATVTIIPYAPAIQVVKSVNATTIHSGETVQYSFNVTNTGDCTLHDVNVVDDTFDFIANPVIGPITLAPGESNIGLLNVTIGGFGTLTNIANATGTSPDGQIATDFDIAVVTVISPESPFLPAIQLVKSVNATSIHSGATVQYTLNVTNTGDATLYNVTVVDDVLDFIANPVIGPTTLDPGESSSALLNVTLGGLGTLTNIANATGTTLDEITVVDIDAATVTIIPYAPAIQLEKSVNATTIHSGETVQYTFNVTNTGDSTLHDITVVDNTLDFIADPVIGPMTLAPGESSVALLNVTIGGLGFLINTANATGISPDGQTVTDFDIVAVTVINPEVHPSLEVTKTGTPDTQSSPGTITWNVTVTNTGDVPLTGINVTDSRHGNLGAFGVLNPEETGFFTIVEYNLPSGKYTDQAFAAGYYAPENLTVIAFSDLVECEVTPPNASLTVTKTGTPDTQFAPGTITWNVTVTNTGDVPLTGVNVTDSRHGYLGAFGTLAPGKTGFFTIVEHDLPPGNYTDQAFAAGFFALENLTVIAFSDPVVCEVKPVYILKQFTDVGVLPDGQAAGFNAELFNQTQVNVTGLKSGPYTYFYVTYYFENSVNFLGDNFDGQAHNFTLWDKWGGNLMALGSEPVSFDPAKNQNFLMLADGSSFKIDPRLQGSNSYRGYIGDGLDISNLASQGDALITMHLGDQQDGTNPGKGKGTNKDSASYDTDIVWYIGELGVNQNATLTLIIAPGKNPGGQLLFGKSGYTVINTGPRVRAYGNTYNDYDFLYSAQRTNTLTVYVKPS
jgi:uncharacterized repeat protein (TIGR01451 family)